MRRSWQQVLNLLRSILATRCARGWGHAHVSAHGCAVQLGWQLGAYGAVGWGWRQCTDPAHLKIKTGLLLRPYSDTSRRQLSNGTGLSSRLHRTRELWGSQVWGYCRVLPAPPALPAFFPLPPVLPHACRTAVRHVLAGDPALPVLVSIGMHGLWLGLGRRGQPGGVPSPPHGGHPALQCPWLHGPLAPADYPWRGYV